MHTRRRRHRYQFYSRRWWRWSKCVTPCVCACVCMVITIIVVIVVFFHCSRRQCVVIYIVFYVSTIEKSPSVALLSLSLYPVIRRGRGSQFTRIDRKCDHHSDRFGDETTDLRPAFAVVSSSVRASRYHSAKVMRRPAAVAVVIAVDHSRVAHTALPT